MLRLSLLLLPLLSVPGAAQGEAPDDRRKCEERHCASHLEQCRADQVCATFEACQRECPVDHLNCLAHCAIGHGMLPSITAIKRMTTLRNCASKFCAYTENGRQPLSCNATTAGNLDKIFEQCKGARPDHCPSATCARMLNHADTRERRGTVVATTRSTDESIAGHARRCHRRSRHVRDSSSLAVLTTRKPSRIQMATAA